MRGVRPTPDIVFDLKKWFRNVVDGSVCPSWSKNCHRFEETCTIVELSNSNYPDPTERKEIIA